MPPKKKAPTKKKVVKPRKVSKSSIKNIQTNKQSVNVKVHVEAPKAKRRSPRKTA